MPQRTVYLVVESSWDYDDCFWHGDDVPVLAFSDQAKAEAHAADRTRAAWAGAGLDPDDDQDRWQADGLPTVVVVPTAVEG